ncbi:AraC family transcriptional regulator [Leucothrix sargassi]|nr:AraC family transcriptional regulator [Leucothrix sargassi]
MKSWKLSPKIEDVAKYVECYWFLEKEQHDQSFNYPKLNPDPCSHLIVSNLNSKHEYNHSAKTQNVSGSHWIFPHLKTFTMDHSAPFRIIGVKFKTGALYSLEINDFSSKLDKIERIDLNHLIGSKVFNADQLLVNATEQKKQVCGFLDEMLLPWLSGFHEDKHSHLVRQVMLLLGNTPIAEIGGILHRSQRTIERSFAKVTGLSMKQTQSMIHLEEILNYLYQLNKEDINWADVANKFGFSDQPHLIRHLKSSIGKTPSHYAKDRDLTIDIYGNFEFD